MRMDKLTHTFQQAIAEGQSIAVGRENPAIEPVHIMKALLDQENGTTRQLLSEVGVDLPSFRSQLDNAIDRLPQIVGGPADIHLSNELVRLLNQSDKLAQQRKDQFISSELFLVAAVTDESGSLGQLFKKTSASKDKLEQAIEKMRGGQTVQDQNAESMRNSLDKSFQN